VAIRKRQDTQGEEEGCRQNRAAEIEHHRFATLEELFTPIAARELSPQHGIVAQRLVKVLRLETSVISKPVFVSYVT
jgi:hypothetical protein